MAGYAFARIEFPFKNFIFVLLLSVLMVPGQIFLLPQYQLIQKMGLVEHHPGAVSSEPVQCLRYIPAAAVLYVHASGAGRCRNRRWL